MRTCPDCDQEIDEEIDACPECGAALTPAEGVTTWNCPKCKQEVTSDYEVCWACGTTIEGVEDPGFLDESNVDFATKEPTAVPEDLATVTKYLLGPEAYAMRDRLAAEGIPAFITDEFTNTVGLLSNTAGGGAKVLVPEHLLERARTVLGIMEEEEVVQEQQEQDDDEEGEDEEAENEEEDTEEMTEVDETATRQSPEEGAVEKEP